jgi:hypothetical protein
MKPKRGRPRILVACPYCRGKYGVAEFRAHLPRCPSKPARPEQHERPRARLPGPMVALDSTAGAD